MLVVFDKRIIINGGMVVLKRERSSENFGIFDFGIL